MQRDWQVIITTFFMCGFSALSQNATLSGKIYDTQQAPVMGVSVHIPVLQKGVISDRNGNYTLQRIPTGNYELKIEGLGFKAETKEITFTGSEEKVLDFYLEESSEALGEVQLVAKSRQENLRESAFEVSVIETAKYRNLSGDLTRLLKATPGINIRETGGLGSDFSLSLNGLSGNQVRFFIDGMPMENFGNSMSLNNFPVNLISDIEVYKGVVPISLGADALGGAVNINTGFKRNSFLDASYSLGSFNTHRAAVNGQYSNPDAKYYVRLLTYFNHSDNDYEMQEVPLYELNLGNYRGEISANRFHSEYTSGMGKVQAGIFDRNWADELAVSATWSKNRNNHQHPSNNINRVFGDFHTRNENMLADIRYRKRWEKLELNAYALAGNIRQETIDTSAYRYNWLGERILRSQNDHRGELYDRRSFIVFDDKVTRSSIQAGYRVDENHSFDVSAVQNSLEREGFDRVNRYNTAIEFPNGVNKVILGLAYNFKSDNEKWEGGIFGKHYLYNADITTQDTGNNISEHTVDLTETGYGVLLTRFLGDNFQVKSSFEAAIRLPEAYEILGDGIYTRPNPNLRPEQSENFNLGFRYRNNPGAVSWSTEGNFFLRNSTNFIRFRPAGPFGEFENLDNVRSLGGELSTQLNFSRFQLNANTTYQHITDQTKTDEGLPNVNYESRVPNIPYFFGNVRLGYELFESQKSGIVQLYWNTRYVHEFFLNWENLGSADSKHIIPTQFANDLEVEFSSASQQYNVSFTAANIFDEALYDNFRIQKPGRAFYLKLRYNINQF